MRYGNLLPEKDKALEALNPKPVSPKSCLLGWSFKSRDLVSGVQGLRFVSARNVAVTLCTSRLLHIF